MKWYEKIIAAHLTVTDQVSHLARLKSDRYFVWQEEGGDDLVADDSHAEAMMAGTTDLFTKQEFDPWANDIGKAFDAFGIAWGLTYVNYEEDTGFTHYEWTWEVLGGED